jgi:beta-mannanase
MPGKIVWLFSLNNFESAATCAAWYPGSAYVDAVGFDEYPPLAAGITPGYTWALTTGKVIMLPEVGGNVTESNEPANSFDNSTILTTVKANWPKVAAIVVWSNGEQIPIQKGAGPLLNDPAVVTLSDLPH